MQQSHISLIDLLVADLQFAGAPRRSLARLQGARSDAEKRAPEYFLVPSHYQQATDGALKAQDAALDDLRLPQ
eukprot:2097681-Prymnesium_polylepis.2